MANKKRSEDYLDAFFNEITSGVKENESASDFARRMQDSSETKKTYDQFADLLTKGVDTAMRYMGPNAQDSGFERPNAISDGFTFVQNELAMIRYDMRRRGAFKDGHQEALRKYYAQMQACRQHFISLEKAVKGEIKARQKRKESHDRFAEGYDTGLKDLLRIFEDAKVYMMRRIQNDLMGK